MDQERCENFEKIIIRYNYTEFYRNTIVKFVYKFICQKNVYNEFSLKNKQMGFSISTTQTYFKKNNKREMYTH